MPCRGRCIWCSEHRGPCQCRQFRLNTHHQIPNMCRCGHGEVWHELVDEILPGHVDPTPTSDSLDSPDSIDSLDSTEELAMAIRESEQLYQSAAVPPSLTPNSTATQAENHLGGTYVSNNNDLELSGNTRSLCVACDTEIRTVMVYPCRHLSLCRSCFDRWRQEQSTCPICRGTIHDYTEM